MFGGPFAEITAPAGALIGGLFGSSVAAGAANKAQRAVADDVTGGAYSASEAQDEAQHPYASMAGDILPQLAFMRPSLRLNLLGRAGGAAIAAGSAAADQWSQGQSLDWSARRRLRWAATRSWRSLIPPTSRGGPTHIGVGLDLGGLIRLQFGCLWIAPGAERAVVVPRGVGKRYGHFACEEGRFVRRAGWPAKDLARGTERAEARLAELTIEFALAPA